MMICFTIAGRQHCYNIPVFELPIHFPDVGPHPINYPRFIQDAILVASLQRAAEKVSDDRVRGALQDGIYAAVEAIQSRAGEHVQIEDGTAGGPPTGGRAQGPGRRE
jgi:capsule polysaccharide modification protein KpsS